MLPRRHILDIWEILHDDEKLLPMATLSLAVDAIKYIDAKSKNDHLVEALELNEFICYMYPIMRPKNRSLLYHVVSDLLGLLMYGVSKKSKRAIENLETINYSEKNVEFFPIIEVWNGLKGKVYKKKHGATDIVEGFIKKIRIEMDAMERHPFVEDIFLKSNQHLKEWLPSLTGFYDKRKKTILTAYEKWWNLWYCDGDKDKVLKSMVSRLTVQAARDFDVVLDPEKLFLTVKKEKNANRKENEIFSKWYKEGVDFLLKI